MNDVPLASSGLSRKAFAQRASAAQLIGKDRIGGAGAANLRAAIWPSRKTGAASRSAIRPSVGVLQNSAG
jgi:hypothetical protein